MKILFNIIFVLTIVIFLPIPVKLSLYFDKGNYDIKIYKFSILEKLKKNTKNDKLQKKDKAKEKNEANSPSSDEKEKFNLISFLKERIDLKILYRNIRDSNFKPRLRVDGFLNYSLGDPMNTAISYGAINMLLPLFYRGTLIFFKSKKFKFDVNPLLESEGYLSTKLNCIIFFSFAHIIYVLFLIFKSILDTREVNPL